MFVLAITCIESSVLFLNISAKDLSAAKHCHSAYTIEIFIFTIKCQYNRGTSSNQFTSIVARSSRASLTRADRFSHIHGPIAPHTHGPRPRSPSLREKPRSHGSIVSRTHMGQSRLAHMGHALAPPRSGKKSTTKKRLRYVLCYHTIRLEPIQVPQKFGQPGNHAA
jgi:hypothetical protein